MNDRQKNKFIMYKAVLSLLDANSAKISSIPAMAVSLTSFKDILASISEKNIQMNTVTEPRATLKTAEQNGRIESAASVADVMDSAGGCGLSFSKRFVVTTLLFDLFDQADVILIDQLDSIMEMFAPTDQQFYLEYKRARVIKDLNH